MIMEKLEPIFSWASFVGKATGTICAGVLILLYVFQNNLLYMPRPPGYPVTPAENPIGYRSPDEWNIKGSLRHPSSSSSTDADDDPIPFESNFIATEDKETIHTWLLLQKNSNKVPTLVYFHGNAANMGFRLQNAAEMYAQVGINVLMVDYRGYGSSSGTPTEAGLKRDAEAIFSFAQAHTKLQGSPLVAFGRSLGGAVSVDIASKRPDLVKAIVLENTFTSIPDMVDILMPVVSSLKFLVLRINWNSLRLISNLKQPILFISGNMDELVPRSHMEALYKAASSSIFADFFSVSGGSHNDTWIKAGSSYYKRLKAFLSSIQKKEGCNAEDKKDNDETCVGQSEKVTENDDVDDQQQRSTQLPAIPTFTKKFTVQ